MVKNYRRKIKKDNKNQYPLKTYRYTKVRDYNNNKNTHIVNTFLVNPIIPVIGHYRSDVELITRKSYSVIDTIIIRIKIIG